MTDAKAKRRLTDINFEQEGAHVAVVHKIQGGPANQIPVLTFKANAVDAVTKATTMVNVKYTFEEFLSNVMNMWSEDAEVLATLLGMDDDADEGTGNDWWQQRINDRLENIELIKSAWDNPVHMEGWTAKQRTDLEALKAKMEPIFKAVTKTDGGKELTVKDYAYTPDKEKPSTWKLRIDDAAHVSGAVAALGKGYRGNKVEIPEADLPAVKRKVRAAHKKFFPDTPIPDAIASKPSSVEKNMSVDNKSANDLVVELEKAQESIKALNAQVAQMNAEKVEKALQSRTEKLSKVVSAEEAATLVKAVGNIADEAWDVIVKTLEAKAKAITTSSLFKELGVGGDVKTENPAGKADEDPLTLYLKSRYSNTNQNGE